MKARIDIALKLTFIGFKSMVVNKMRGRLEETRKKIQLPLLNVMGRVTKVN
jgi:hypothetical protein